MIRARSVIIRGSSSLTLAMMALASWPALAQTAAAPRSDDGDGGLQEIVVTAQRRSENLQRAAVSVTAMSSEELTRHSVTTAADLTTAVPALQASNQSGYTAFYIRGIGSVAINPYAEPAVAFNLNGVYISRPNAINGQFFDVERVEVLKGPQGILYGRNATGGAVNLIARKPDLGEFNGYAALEYGNYDNIVASGALNMPLGPDGGLRVAVQRETRDGYFRDGSDDADSLSFRLSMRANLTPDLSVNIVGDYSKLGGMGGGATLLPLGTTPIRGGLGDPAVTAYFRDQPANSFIFPGAITPLPQSQAHLDTKTGGVLAEVTARTPVGTLTALAAYREVSANNLVTTPSFFTFDLEKDRQTSFEARLASGDSGPVRYLVGGYYFEESNDFVVKPDGQFIGVVQNGGYQGTKTAAAFSQLTYAPTDVLRFTGGLRYTWEKKRLNGTVIISPPAVFTSGPDLDPLVIVPSAPVAIADAARSFHSTTWKVGVEWDAAPQSMIYASVGTGFKAGGFFMAQNNNSYDPEKVTSYVIGSKNRFFDNKLQLNAEAFLLKYRGQQLAHLGFVNGLDGPISGFPTENIGRSTIYGVEAEAKFLPVPSLLLGLQVNYVHSRYDSFVYQTPDISGLLQLPPGTIVAATGCPTTLATGMYSIDCSGRPMYQSPTWTISGNIQKTFELGNGATFVAEARSRYESARWVSDSYLPITYAGGNTQTDASLTYNAPDKQWSLSAFVNNIENKNVITNAFLHIVYPVASIVASTLRPPRTYGIRGRLSF